MVLSTPPLVLTLSLGFVGSLTKKGRSERKSLKTVAVMNVTRRKNYDEVSLGDLGMITSWHRLTRRILHSNHYH